MFTELLLTKDKTSRKYNNLEEKLTEKINAKKDLSNRRDKQIEIKDVRRKEGSEKRHKESGPD